MIENISQFGFDAEFNPEESKECDSGVSCFALKGKWDCSVLLYSPQAGDSQWAGQIIAVVYQTVDERGGFYENELVYGITGTLEEVLMRLESEVKKHIYIAVENDDLPF